MRVKITINFYSVFSVIYYNYMHIIKLLLKLPHTHTSRSKSPSILNDYTLAFSNFIYFNIEKTSNTKHYIRIDLGVKYLLLSNISLTTDVKRYGLLCFQSCWISYHSFSNVTNAIPLQLCLKTSFYFNMPYIVLHCVYIPKV